MKKDREDYRFYRIWGDMNYRCNTPTCKAYKNYGARGISVCDKWRHYNGFKEDMWETYKEHVARYGEKQTTLDRIDVNGNYTPENCKWSNYTEQCINKRDKLYYVGIRLSDNYKVLFNNRTEFCKKNNFVNSKIVQCIYGKVAVYKGWSFRVATEDEIKTMTIYDGPCLSEKLEKFDSTKKELDKEKVDLYTKYYKIYSEIGWDEFQKQTGYEKSKPNLVQNFKRYVKEFVPQNGKKRGK